MNLRIVLYSFCLMIFCGLSLAINFSRINLAWQYDVNAELRFSHRVVQENEQINVFLQIDADSLFTWKFKYFVQNGYASDGEKEINPLAIDTLRAEKNSVLVRIKLPMIKERLFVIEAYNSFDYLYYDVGLKIGSLSHSSIYPVDSNGVPILASFINRSGFQWKGSHSFHAMKYMDQFVPADPPMAEMKPLLPNVPMDTSFVFSDSVEFDEGAFYTVRIDSTASVGVTMLRVPPYFPEYRRLNELVESMLYITSEAEKKSLINSKNIKQSFDSFWMNNFNTKSRARYAIKKYYDKVELANRLFTQFKPGWKTDRGMMFIVFGMPDEVYRTDNLEEWYYDSGEAFEFTIISSFFAPQIFSLRRSKDLEETWYQHIAAIRRGINE